MLITISKQCLATTSHDLISKISSPSSHEYQQMQGLNNDNSEYAIESRTELQYFAPQNENYMVLYNGNAEVVGNFRALNFYKSSDINIKEDIRLLTEGTYKVSVRARGRVSLNQ
jgi:hypothetical protein